MPKTLDLTGQVFKTWKAIKRVPSKNGKTYWLCECQNCGKQKEVQTNHLRKLTVGTCLCGDNNKNKSYNLIIQRKCDICGKDFYIQDKGYSRKYCYECSPHENENCSHAQAVTIKRRAIKKALVLYKGGKCEICGYNKCMRALEFHHLNPNEKDFTLSRYLTREFSDLKKEVDKCILVCSNCHAEIHDKEEQDKINNWSVADK